MATAEFEIDTDGARSLLEIGFDLGVEATLAALGITGEDGPGPPNLFRRASTVIVEPAAPPLTRPDFLKQLERVEADAEANARAHAQASAEHYTEAERAHERATDCTCYQIAVGAARACPIHRLDGSLRTEAPRAQTATVCPAGRDCLKCGPLPTHKARP